MMKTIESPVAIATVRWRTASEGGRSSGPPTISVYAPTCVFPLGNEEEVLPGWPATGEPTLSILIERIETLVDGKDRAKIGFLFPELALPYLHVGAAITILEGVRIVADAIVEKLL